MKEAGGISFGDSVKDFARKCKGKQGRARLAAAVGVLAMLLILLSELFPQNTAAGSTKNTKSVQSSTEYQAQLENRLEHLISQMRGAGKTTVMVTLETGEEAIYALDTQSGEMQSQQTHILLEDGSARPKRYVCRRCAVWPCCARAVETSALLPGSPNW